MATTRALSTANIVADKTTTDAANTDALAAKATTTMLGTRNLIHNGAMQVAQRGTSVAGITGTGYNTADRWKMFLGTLGTWTQSVEADGPAGSGLTKSLKMLCTTADASPAAADYGFLMHGFEGQDVQRLAYGGASAKQVTLSFWVKANVTGTYVAELRQPANSRTVSGSYTVSASATWEYKTITFPADVVGSLLNDNSGALNLYLYLAAGSDYTTGTLPVTWGTASGRAAGQVNVAAATNNYWQLTGVQLEVGTAATPFEFKSFGQELTACLRYLYMFQNSEMSTGSQRAFAFASNTNMIRAVIPFPVRMRTEPTLVSNSGTNYFVFYDGVTQDYFNALTINASGLLSAEVYSDSNIAATQFRPGHFYTGHASAYVGFNADF